MEEFSKIVQYAIEQKASDIHIVAGSLPFIRVSGKLLPVGKKKLEAGSVLKMASNLLSQLQLKELDTSGDVDVGTIVGDISLRINIHKQEEGMAMAIRVIPTVIPTPEDLGFHETMMQIPDMEEGLVIISGPTGSGKSTTMASLVEVINQRHNKHIITLEDPIEYRFKNAKSLVEQRQVGTHFPTFPKGLRHVLRQDPNVIVVGEMRDNETISLALTAAETGHLVISTLHAPNAAEVVERIVNVFDGSEQHQILVQLAATLQTVVAQRLLPTIDGGLVAAREILTSTSAVQNAIRTNNLSVIRSAIQTGKKAGMISLEQSIKALQKEKLIG